jgi:tetratricopeptide repeat protein 21B
VATKLCQSLIKTHQYSKAIQVYEEVIKFDENFHLRLDLAKLHVNLEQWSAAEKTIQDALLNLKDSSLSRLIMEADLLTLLAKVGLNLNILYLKRIMFLLNLYLNLNSKGPQRSLQL